MDCVVAVVAADFEADFEVGPYPPKTAGLLLYHHYHQWQYFGTDLHLSVPVPCLFLDDA